MKAPEYADVDSPTRGSEKRLEDVPVALEIERNNSKLLGEGRELWLCLPMIRKGK